MELKFKSNFLQYLLVILVLILLLSMSFGFYYKNNSKVYCESSYLLDNNQTCYNSENYIDKQVPTMGGLTLTDKELMGNKALRDKYLGG